MTPELVADGARRPAGRRGAAPPPGRAVRRPRRRRGARGDGAERHRGVAAGPRVAPIARACRRAALRRPRHAQGPGAHRAAQLRHHRSRAGRSLPRARRLPGLRALSRPALARGRRHGQGRRSARPRRGRLSHLGEVARLSRGRRRLAQPHLQRRRGRSRRLHEPIPDRGRSARRRRRHADRRLRDRRRSRLRLHQGRVPAGHRAPAHRPGGGPQAGPAGRPYPRLRLLVRRHPQRGSRRLRLRRGDRAHRQHRGSSRHAAQPAAVPRRRRGSGNGRPSSTTSRRWRRCRPSSVAAPPGMPATAPRPRRAPRRSPWWARCGAPA